jgi:RNA polymerase sigma-70 factor (ECF subfamily)
LQQGSPRELVEHARRGDERAFGQLVAAYQRTALAIAYAVVGESSAAADVTQDAMVRAWQRLEDLDDPDRFGPWLARIVRNLAHDHLRRKPRREVAQIDNQKPADGSMRLVIDPAREVDRNETRQTINTALAELDETSRAAVALRYYEDMGSKEIGELLDLSPAAVDMRLSRARAQLREKLAGLNPVNSPDRNMKCPT